MGRLFCKRKIKQCDPFCKRPKPVDNNHNDPVTAEPPSKMSKTQERNPIFKFLNGKVSTKRTKVVKTKKAPKKDITESNSDYLERIDKEAQIKINQMAKKNTNKAKKRKAFSDKKKKKNQINENDLDDDDRKYLEMLRKRQEEKEANKVKFGEVAHEPPKLRNKFTKKAAAKVKKNKELEKKQSAESKLKQAEIESLRNEAQLAYKRLKTARGGNSIDFGFKFE
eukprot:TRINITY_DN778289_c0_g1_i1.p1 TRINITY_DN778289_c0_g1~~TRINITY_DN778289_c0_g1_i1.p1  ORF type:complete len:239 (-),score=89.01 TRINITY_DN778289_c0_g1_i1:90-761(-)